MFARFPSERGFPEHVAAKWTPQRRRSPGKDDDTTGEIHPRTQFMEGEPLIVHLYAGESGVLDRVMTPETAVKASCIAAQPISIPSSVQRYGSHFTLLIKLALSENLLMERSMSSCLPRCSCILVESCSLEVLELSHITRGAQHLLRRSHALVNAYAPPKLLAPRPHS